jgi:hypothetical protein
VEFRGLQAPLSFVRIFSTFVGGIANYFEYLASQAIAGEETNGSDALKALVLGMIGGL